MCHTLWNTCAGWLTFYGIHKGYCKIPEKEKLALTFKGYGYDDPFGIKGDPDCPQVDFVKGSIFKYLYPIKSHTSKSSDTIVREIRHQHLGKETKMDELTKILKVDYETDLKRYDYNLDRDETTYHCNGVERIVFSKE